MGGDAPSGDIDVKLYGNCWQFQPGHLVQLQVTQSDVPYLRPDNLPSSITWSTPMLTLPTHEAKSGALAGA